MITDESQKSSNSSYQSQNSQPDPAQVQSTAAEKLKTKLLEAVTKQNLRLEIKHKYQEALKKVEQDRRKDSIYCDLVIDSCPDDEILQQIGVNEREIA